MDIQRVCIRRQKRVNFRSHKLFKRVRLADDAGACDV